MEATETSKTFSELIASGKPVLVDFFAEWCGPCKLMTPILEELKGKVGDKVTIIKVDVDKSPLVASTFNIRGVPTLMLFENREVKWRKSGVIPANYLEQIIHQNQ